jgi:hypothetical protein
MGASLIGEGLKKPDASLKSFVGLSSRSPSNTDVSSRFIRPIKKYKER